MYFEYKGESPKVFVFLDKKKIGIIRKKDGKYQYVPNGGVKYASEPNVDLDFIKREIERLI